jgi:glycosyltransferase involved in cell wall biosynthesis
VNTVVAFTDSVDFSGAERMLVTLMARLDRCRWRPIVMHHPGARRLVRESHEADMQTREVPFIDTKWDLSHVWTMVRQLRANRARVFHAHLNWPGACVYGMLAAGLARVPARIATQQLFPDVRSRRLRRRQAAVSRIVHRYIAVSDDIRRELCASGAKPEKVRVIPNGIEPERFSIGRRVRAADDPPLVLTVARLENHKGLPYLLGAAARLPGVRFAIAGEGSERPALESEARRLGVEDRVNFLGERADVPELLATCDVFALPSLFEGLPVAVLEAMAAGTPVIATAIRGTTDAVQHGVTGWLVPAGDASGLANGIRTVLADRPLAARLAGCARAVVEQRFSVAAVAARTSELYQEVLRV